MRVPQGRLKSINKNTKKESYNIFIINHMIQTAWCLNIRGTTVSFAFYLHSCKIFGEQLSSCLDKKRKSGMKCLLLYSILLNIAISQQTISPFGIYNTTRYQKERKIWFMKTTSHSEWLIGLMDTGASKPQNPSH